MAGRYVWLPIEFQNHRPSVRWRNGFDLSAPDVSTNFVIEPARRIANISAADFPFGAKS
jgi:hypothetical protein